MPKPPLGWVYKPVSSLPSQFHLVTVIILRLVVRLTKSLWGLFVCFVVVSMAAVSSYFIVLIFFFFTMSRSD